MKRTWFRLLLLLCAAGAALVFGQVRAVGQDGRQQPSAKSVREQQAAYAVGGLKAAAAVTGTYRSRISFPMSSAPDDLDELIAFSHSIVVGMVDQNRCLATSDGFSVVTVYDVRIERTLKGSFKKGEVIPVAVPGGKISFPNGSSAELTVERFRPPLNSRRYIFFLRRSDARDGYLVQGGVPGYPEYLVPSAGPLGIYDLSSTWVVPSGAAGSNLARTIWSWRVNERGLVDRVLDVLKSAGVF